MAAESKHPTYRKDIDGLRAVAVLSVVAYHVGLPGILGGFTGVDVFFVISGYLITQLLCKEASTTDTISIAGFYARRMRRLLPSFATVIAFTLIAGAFLLPPFGEKQDLARSAISSVCFLANHYFLSFSGGYFASPGALLPLLHVWSLSVEEQFYLVWPIIILLIIRFSHRSSRLVRIQTVLTSIVITSLCLSIWMVYHAPNTAFYTLPSRAWEIGTGGLVAVTQFRVGPPRSAALGRVTGVVGLLLVVIAAVWIRASMPFPGIVAAVPVLGAACIIISGAVWPRGFVPRLLGWQPLVFIGLISYAWYLWHWPLLSLARSRRLSAQNLTADIGVAALAFILASVTVRLLENPIRHGPRFKYSQRATLKAGTATLASLLLLSAGVGAWTKYGPKSEFVIAARNEMPASSGQCLFSDSQNDGPIFKRACDQVPNHNVRRGAMALVWGDSAADAWSPAVLDLGAAQGIEVQEVTRGACPPLLGTTVRIGNRRYFECQAFNSAVIKKLEGLRAANRMYQFGVVLTALWPEYLGRKRLSQRYEDRWYYDEGKGSLQENLNSLERGLLRTFGEMNRIGARVVVLLTGPEFRIAPIRCAAFGYSPGMCDQPRPELDRYRRPATEVVLRVARRFENVRIVDPISFFCGSERCSAYRSGHPVAYDDIHISVSGAKAFEPLMSQDFSWMFQDR